MSDSPLRVERTDAGMRFTLDVAARTQTKQLKKAEFGQFEILCDESATIGGDDTAPLRWPTSGPRWPFDC